MKTSKHHREKFICLVMAALFASLVLVACGSSSSQDPASPAPDYAKKLAGSPPPLAALHEQANELLDGGKNAFNQRLAELKGFPVVANMWASWCGPCRAEFPFFQQNSAKLGQQVAFVGVNVTDSAELAKKLLTEAPLSYPSYTDQDKSLTSDLGDTFGGLPATAFFDKDGRRTYTHQGQYKNSDELKADIKNYAIEGNSG